jgi:hypothetical protein
MLMTLSNEHRDRSCDARNKQDSPADDPTEIYVGQKWVSNNDPKLVITIKEPVVNQHDTWAVTSSVGVPFMITTNDVVTGYRLT